MVYVDTFIESAKWIVALAIYPFLSNKPWSSQDGHAAMLGVAMFGPSFLIGVCTGLCLGRCCSRTKRSQKQLHASRVHTD